MNTDRTRNAILAFSLFLITACGGAGTPAPGATENGAPTTVSQTETPPSAELTYCPMTTTIDSEITSYCLNTSPGLYSGQFKACRCRWNWILKNHTCAEIVNDPASVEAFASWRSGC